MSKATGKFRVTKTGARYRVISFKKRNTLKKKISALNSTMLALRRYQRITLPITNVTNAGSVTLVNGMQTGDVDGTRDGTLVGLKTLWYRYTILPVAALSVVRVMLVYDKSVLGTTPLIGDILATADVNSMIKHDNRNRFKVLYDRTIPVDTARGSVAKRGYIKVNRRTQYYTGANNGNVVDIQKGALWWVFVSNVAANYPTLDMHNQFTYDP